MVSGGAYVAQGLLAPPLVRLLIPDDGAPVSPALEEEGVPPELVIPGGETIGAIETVFFTLLALSVMALVAALQALQAESYGPGAVERVGLGALTVLPTIAEVVLILVGYLAPLPNPVVNALTVVGFVVASVGFFALAMATLVVRVFPRWVAGMLLAGSPPAAVFLGPFFGVPWALVGYAVLRAVSGRDSS
jgi:hypothetical protein